MLLFRLTFAIVKMIARNRQALFWSLAFPVVMLGIFGMVGGFGDSAVRMGEESSFLEFALPGIALWGIMSNSIIGLAASMASYREKKILRRIKASPLKPSTFFAAHVLAYLALSLVQATLILGLGALVFGAPVGGNLLVIGALILFCNIVFLNIGFIVGAYSKTVAAASGLGNVVVLPLVMFSGVFFPPEVMPGFLSEVMRFLPLAPMVEILRGITLGAKTVLDFPFEIGLIVGWTCVTALTAVRVFKLE